MSDYCLNEGIKKLKQLGITGDLKEWYIKNVLSKDDIEHFKFLVSYSNLIQGFKPCRAANGIRDK